MVIIPPESGIHDCQKILPHDSIGYGSTGVVDGSVVQCRICKRWYVSVGAYESLGPTSKWVPVRWWHRKARQLIRTWGE